MTNLNVTVLGGGSWGTTVASLVSRNAPVTLWARPAIHTKGAPQQLRPALPALSAQRLRSAEP